MTQNITGFDNPGDQKVPVTVRDWDAMKRAIWRGKHAFEIVIREGLEIVGRCRHTEGCPGAALETEPCFDSCPDRENRMSALVCVNAARQLATARAPKPADGPFFSPSREYFSEVLAELAATQVENERLRNELRTVPAPAPEMLLEDS